MKTAPLRDLRLDLIAQGLITQGLPPEYVDRLRRELTDHADDASTDGSVDATSLLSDAPNSFSQFAVKQYRSARFEGRHPGVVFLLAPIPVAIAMWIVFHGMMFGLVVLFAPDISDSLDWQGRSAFDLYPICSLCCYSAFVIGKWLPLFLVGAFFTRIGLKSGRPLRWIYATLVILTLFACFGYVSEFELPNSTNRDASFRVHDFEIESTFLLIMQIVQAMAPMSGYLYARRIATNRYCWDALRKRDRLRAHICNSAYDRFRTG